MFDGAKGWLRSIIIQQSPFVRESEHGGPGSPGAGFLARAEDGPKSKSETAKSALTTDAMETLRDGRLIWISLTG
jgi:hypothetical protein